MSKQSFLFTLAVLWLAGCTQIPDFSALISKSEEPPVQVRQKILLSPSVYGVSNSQKKKKAIQANKTTQEAKVEPLVLLLRQKSEAEIRTLLGTPQRTLREGRLLVWQYVTTICQWDMYFQEDPSQRNTALYDLIIHHQGRILTADNEIKQCEQSLRETKIT